MHDSNHYGRENPQSVRLLLVLQFPLRQRTFLLELNGLNSTGSRVSVGVGTGCVRELCIYPEMLASCDGLYYCRPTRKAQQ